VTYEHTQSRPHVAVGLLVVAVVIAVLALVADAPYLLVTPAVLLVVAGIAYAMSSLTTVVTSDAITVRFRWGRPHRVISFTKVTGCDVARNKWWYGWGIRVIPGATMYNVWGLDAVHLELADTRDFRIGTDDPGGLAAAIDERIPGDRT